MNLFNTNNAPYYGIIFSIVWLAFFLHACTSPVSNISNKSCAPFSIQAGESATYTFADSGSTEEVSVQVVNIQNNIAHVTISDSGNISSLTLSTHCGEVLSGVAGPKSRFILYGDLWLSVAQTTANTSVSADATAATDWAVQCEATEETLKTEAGWFPVQKCTLTPKGADLVVRHVVRYTKFRDQTDTQPFAGIIKEVVEFRDGSQATVQLTQWNNL